jgi:hypothetical protein
MLAASRASRSPDARQMSRRESLCLIAGQVICAELIGPSTSMPWTLTSRRRPAQADVAGRPLPHEDEDSPSCPGPRQCASRNTRSFEVSAEAPPRITSPRRSGPSLDGPGMAG